MCSAVLQRSPVSRQRHVPAIKRGGCRTRSVTSVSDLLGDERKQGTSLPLLPVTLHTLFLCLLCPATYTHAAASPRSLTPNTGRTALPDYTGLFSCLQRIHKELWRFKLGGRTHTAPLIRALHLSLVCFPVILNGNERQETIGEERVACQSCVQQHQIRLFLKLLLSTGNVSNSV